MNIFCLDENPVIAAQMMCDKHTVKMCLETAQLLSSAHHVLDPGPHPNLYRLTHKNHPSAIWARANDKNYKWLFEHFVALLDEYSYRYSEPGPLLESAAGRKTHKCAAMVPFLEHPPAGIHLRKKRDDFAKAIANPAIKAIPDPVEAYRQYYIQEKAGIVAWNKTRPAPYWWPTSNP